MLIAFLLLAIVVVALLCANSRPHSEPLSADVALALKTAEFAA